jgi:hypothetical protein
MKHYSIEVLREEDFNPDTGCYEGIKHIVDGGTTHIEARAALVNYLDGLAARGFVIFQNCECDGEYRATQRDVALLIQVTSTETLLVN